MVVTVVMAVMVADYSTLRFSFVVHFEQDVLIFFFHLLIFFLIFFFLIVLAELPFELCQLNLNFYETRKYVQNMKINQILFIYIFLRINITID